MPPVTKIPACALVLAGGRSARFGSDKALALVRGETLLGRTLRAAGEIFERVAVVAKAPEKYRALAGAGVALVADDSPRETPLAGIAAGLAWCQPQAAFVCGADMPLAPSLEPARALWEKFAGAPAAAFAWHGRVEPLCAFYATSCLAAAERLRDAGAGPSRLLEEVGARIVDYAALFPDDAAGRPFADADTPAALAALAIFF